MQGKASLISPFCFFFLFLSPYIYIYIYIYTIVLKPDPTGRPRTRPTWAELKKKQGKKKSSVTRSKTRLQVVDFCFLFFLLKRRRFDFF
jgi:hypothetical protein